MNEMKTKITDSILLPEHYFLKIASYYESSLVILTYPDRFCHKKRLHPRISPDFARELSLTSEIPLYMIIEHVFKLSVSRYLKTPQIIERWHQNGKY